MKLKVLFVGPKYMNLYKDVIGAMERKGYGVDFLPEKTFKDDPYNVRGYSRFSKIFVNRKKFARKLDCYWTKLLNSSDYDKRYDYVFVLDGQSISSVFFDTLKKRNARVKFVNYLFDTTSGVYHFEKNFIFFDRVFTFDVTESQKYNIGFLPIYWMDNEETLVYRYNIFGLGAIKNERYALFSRIERIAKKNNLSYYLKLYNFVKVKNAFFYRFRCCLYSLLRLKNIVSLQAIQSPFATTESVPPRDFRKYIAGADIVIDTSAPNQDGLTARFMWSIGLGKKVLTTNSNVKQYDFFDEKQILVIDEKTKDDEIESFFLSEFSNAEKNKNRLLAYRIDNWLETLLG